VTFSSEGSKEVTAKCCSTCGDGKTVYINVIKPWVESIDFGGTNNFTMKDACSSPNTIYVEYDKSDGDDDAACQLMDDAVTLNSVVFSGPNNLTYSTAVKVYAIDWLLVSFPETNDTWHSWESGGVTMTSSSDLPDGIDKHTMDLTWMYKVVGGDGSGHFCDSVNPTSHDVYAVLGTPNSPQSQPWQEVLEIACDEASGETTAAGATRAIWDNFYNEPSAEYDTDSGAPRYCANPVATTGNFKLSTWLPIYNNPFDSIGKVNCYDMGKVVVTFANALGCGTVYAHVYPFGYENCIKPVGCGWTNNPFHDHGPPVDPNLIVDGDANSSDGRSAFSNHAFARLSGDIYDASGGQVDDDANPDEAPHTARELDGDDTWSNDYDGRVIDDTPSSSPGTPTNYSFGVQ
jgi:hypothetical protein